MQISQIFLTDSEDQTLPPFLQFATSTVKASFPDHTHVIYDNETLRDFIAKHYDKDIVWAYDKLRPYSYKSDLGRYCILNITGGWYFDIAIRCHQPIKLNPNIDLLAFRDIQRNSQTTWACTSAVLYAKPGIDPLQKAINIILQNCKDGYYGITPLCPTGPTVFGSALAASRARSTFIFGDFMELTPQFENANRAFVMPDGSILAWGKPFAGGDLTETGAEGVNNYNSLWQAREVYAPD